LQVGDSIFMYRNCNAKDDLCCTVRSHSKHVEAEAATRFWWTGLSCNPMHGVKEGHGRKYNPMHGVKEGHGRKKRACQRGNGSIPVLW
jgi:hypothetical protein